MRRKKILVVTYGGGHAKMLRPVVSQLTAKSEYEVVVLALTMAKLEFEGLGVRMVGYKDFFQGPEVMRYGARLASELTGNVLDLDESIAYLGQNYLELVNEHGENQAATLYKKCGRQAFSPAESMKHILSEVSPDVVVATNSPRSEKAAVYAANSLGLKAVALIDMFAVRCKAWFSDNDFADKILVFDESVKKFLENEGRRAADVVVTGNPSFDQLAQCYKDQKKDIGDERENGDYTILWASQREPEYEPETMGHGDPRLPVEIESQLMKIIAKHNWKLIVRSHPNEERRLYDHTVEISGQSESLETLLRRVDVVVTMTSTVGLQGIVLGADLVTIDMSVLTPTVPLSESGISTGVSDLASLEPVLLKLKDNVAARGGKDARYKIVGAASNVVREIESLL